MSIGSKKGPYYRLPNQSFIYKWSPSEYEGRNKKTKFDSRVQACTATPRSNGEDFNVTYVYDRTVDPNGMEHRYAYVECGYVE